MPNVSQVFLISRTVSVAVSLAASSQPRMKFDATSVKTAMAVLVLRIRRRSCDTPDLRIGRGQMFCSDMIKRPREYPAGSDHLRADGR